MRTQVAFMAGLVFLCSMAFLPGIVSASTIHVPADYPTIQGAVDAANPGDTVIVGSGTYKENVDVGKSLDLEGVDTGAGLPVVDGSGGNALCITGGGSVVHGLNVTNASYGIAIFSGGNNVSGNTATHNTIGIYIGDNLNPPILTRMVGGSPENGIPASTSLNNQYYIQGSNNTITGNVANDNQYGIYSTFSGNNVYRNNRMSGNQYNFYDFPQPDTPDNIDTTNLVDGRPVYYLAGVSDLVLDGSSNAGAVFLIECNNVTVRGLSLHNDSYGIYLYHTRNSCIEDNAVSNSIWGIYLMSSCTYNAVYGNTLTNNMGGIGLFFGLNNTVSGNKANNNTLGIHLMGTALTTMRNNDMAGNSHNFGDVEVFDVVSGNDIDTSNLVDGRPIYYLNGTSDRVIDGSSGAGTVYLLNCRNITVRDMTLRNNHHGVGMAGTVDSRIQNITVEDVNTGIELFNSNNSTILGNHIDNDQTGIDIISSHGNSISGNTANDNGWTGIYVCMSDSNTITGNDFLHNDNASICLLSSKGNCIFSNRFMGKNGSVTTYDNGVNRWCSTTPMQYRYNGHTYTHYIGNCWGDYTGPDSDGDGIYDVPYQLDANNTDPYPLSQAAEPISSYCVSLHKGWNLVSVPVLNDSSMASGVPTGLGIDRVAAFDGKNQTFDAYLAGVSRPDRDIGLVPDKGYFIHCARDNVSLVLYGTRIGGPRTITLYPGWNLVGWSPSYNSTARDFGGSSPYISRIARYDAGNASYSTYVVGSGLDDNFAMSAGNGYFVYSNATSAIDVTA